MTINKLTEISSEMKAAQEKLLVFAKTEGKAAIGAALAKCFEAPTNLVRIEWTQYTPHFNDGDTCTFRVHEPTLFTETEEDGEQEHEYYCFTSFRDVDYVLKAKQALGEKTIAAFLEVWDQLEEPILEAVFGDHVKVTVTKDEVTVEEYNHD